MKLPKLSLSLNTAPVITAPSQRHLAVADIVDDLILTKEGGAALILQTSALNFSLLSGREQEAIIAAYSAFLNSLSFTVQIFIRSQKKDVSSYLAFLSQEEGKITNPQLRALMTNYRQFVTSIVKKKNVLEKEFFLVIPFSPFELGVSPGALASLLPLKLGPRVVPFTKESVMEKAKTVLGPRRDHIIRQSARLGIKVHQLETPELVALLLKIYHPEKEEKQNGQP